MASGPHPPEAPRIPLQAVQSLIPRLTSTINDIDSFKNLIASGHQEGTLPNWETLLSRYSLLQSRLSTIQTFLQTPAPPHPSRPSPPSSKPALKSYLVHPLSPLPPGHDHLASQLSFEAINTIPLPAISSSNASLLSNPRFDGAIDSHAVRDLDDEGLGRVKAALENRVASRNHRMRGLLEVIDEVEGVYDWGYRMGVDEDKDADDGPGGDEEDDMEDVVVVAPQAGEGGGVDEETTLRDQTGEQGGEKMGRRIGWALADYVRYMDTGREPVSRDNMTA